MGNYIRFDWMIKRLLRDKILEKITPDSLTEVRDYQELTLQM